MGNTGHSTSQAASQATNQATNQTSYELEDGELEPFEDLPESAVAASDAPHTRPTLRPDASRLSAPPPIPAAARVSRPSGFQTSPGMSLPPPPPAGRASSPSGIFPRAQTTPMPPPPSPIGKTLPPPSGRDAVAELARVRDELARAHAQTHALEHKLRLRDDLIAELQRALKEQRQLVAEVEKQRHAALAQKPAATQDDLKRIHGIGPAFEQRLQALGVTRFEQIAAWTEEDIERIATGLAILPARISRDGWIERARELLSAHEG